MHDDPTVKAWAKGAGGESRLAAFIDRELGERVVGLHDRFIPGTRAANIDHIYVAPSGVWVVDAKTYSGKVEKRDVGPLWRQELELFVGGRNRTKLADGMRRQLQAVRAAIEPDPAASGVDIHGVLCFVDSEWSAFARPFDVRGITVAYPGALRGWLKAKGRVDQRDATRLAARLAVSLPPARS